MDKQDLVNEILDRELAMFQAVKTDQAAPCRDHPETFRNMRNAQFQAWSVETLASYCDDLTSAARGKRNLMTLKYARMDNRIPVLNNNKLIPEIVAIQVAWQKEMAQNYPHLINRGRPIDGDHGYMTSFERYLACELETYSDLTIACLRKDLQNALDRKENLTEKVYTLMVKGLGYQSIEEAEKEAGARHP